MKLIIISAPSGAGKTTLCRKLLHEFSDQINLSISTTTRPPRGGEKHGHDYLFLSEDVFKKMMGDGEFAEYAQVHGYFYGTAKSTIEDSLNSGKAVLLDIDVQGAASLRQAYPDQCITIFITPPSIEELESRLRNRGTDKEEAIQKRIQNASQEMSQSDQFDFVVINDNFDRAYSEVRDIVRKNVLTP